MSLQVVTGSLLREGSVAYLKLEDGRPCWTTDIREASAAPKDSEDLQTLLDAASADIRTIIIAPYTIDVEATDSGFAPSSIRERIRALGPTVALPTFHSEARSAA